VTLRSKNIKRSTPQNGLGIDHRESGGGERGRKEQSRGATENTDSTKNDILGVGGHPLNDFGEMGDGFSRACERELEKNCRFLSTLGC